MSGLTDEGLEVETFETVTDSMKAKWLGKFPGADVSDESPDGIIINIVGESAALCWEGLEQVHNATDPDAATGAAQDAICALTGTIREAARPSTVELTLVGTPGTPVPVESRAKDENEATWETAETGTIVAATAWAAATPYIVGDIRTNGGNVYVCITAGTSAGAGGPTTEATDITDNTAHWRWIGEGTGFVKVDGQCTVDGPTVGVAYSINEIDTPISGWNAVINLLDADVGANQESHESLRARREAEIGAQGSTIHEAIRSELLLVAGVTAATVFYNASDATDADGVPPKSVECLVTGGDDADILECLYGAVAAGIQAYGDITGLVEDEEGNEHELGFSRPEDVNTWVIITVEVDPDVWPATGGEDEVKLAIATWGEALGSGRDVRSSRVGAVAMTEVDGVMAAPTVLIGTANPPVASADIVITNRQQARFDTSRIVVNVVVDTP